MKTDVPAMDGILAPRCKCEYICDECADMMDEQNGEEMFGDGGDA